MSRICDEDCVSRLSQMALAANATGRDDREDHKSDARCEKKIFAGKISGHRAKRRAITDQEMDTSADWYVFKKMPTKIL